MEYRIRIRNAADSSDALVVTSTRGGTNPYLVDAPTADGAEFDPLTGAYRSGSCSVRIADAITSGTSRVLTSQLEDSDFRQQLAGRPAYVEYRENAGSWVSMAAGIVTGIRLSSSAVYDVDVGDSMRATRNLVAFSPKRDAEDATQIEPLADYLARWPNRGTLAGGPVLGGFLGLPDLGGWEFKVSRDTDTFGSLPVKYLEFVGGFTAPDFTRTTNLADLAGILNDAIGPGISGYAASSFPADLAASPWRDLVVRVDSGYYAAGTIAQASALKPDPAFFGFVTNGDQARGIFIVDPGDVLSTGAAIHRVWIFDALPSERCPIYFSGHPIDLWTALCDEAGLVYDTEAVDAVRDALGRSLRINLRITSPQPLASFMESVLYGPCGFSVRTNADRELVPFTTRVTGSDAPETTLTNDDVPKGQSVLFDLSEPDAITKVVFEQQNLRPALLSAVSPQGGYQRTATAKGTDTRTAKERLGAAPLDGITVQQVTVERTSGDTAAAVQREQSYTLPGFLDTGSGSYEPGLVDAAAKEIFDRWGRGRLSGEVSVLRDGSAGDVLLGDEIIVALGAMPNHNKRLGDDNSVAGRAVQIVRSTPSPSGPRFRFIDSGPNAQPVATVPTLSIGAGPYPGSTVVTITNATTLNTAGIGVRVQWAVTSGGAPELADYVDVAAFDPATVPTGAIALPAVIPGRTVYVRARSEQPGARPSNYSTGVHFDTTGFSPPSDLSATPDATDGTRAQLAWVIGTGADTLRTDVFVRLSSASATADVRRLTLLPGSIAATLEKLAANTEYIASVQHRDERTGAVSVKTTVTFTTSAEVSALVAPTDAAVFAGRHGEGADVLDGSYGLAVVATSLPGDVEFDEAIETAIGADTYWYASSVGVLPAVIGDWTRIVMVAPNDGLRRQLRARTRNGTHASDWTEPLAVLPWSVVELPRFVGSNALTLRVVSDTDEAGNVAARVYVADPSPTADVPITITASASGFLDGDGEELEDSVLPESAVLELPSDAITDDLETTASALFVIAPPPAGSRQGRVNFVATRAGRTASVAASIDIGPRSLVAPQPIVGTITAEASAGGSQVGMVYIPLTFAADIAEYRIYTGESEEAGAAVVDYTNASLSAVIRRLEGVIESADDWTMVHAIATTAEWWRKLVILAVGFTGLQSEPFADEVQAVDTGTGPTDPATGQDVADSTVSGLARKTLTFTIGDAAASHQVWRNGTIVAVLEPEDDTFVDDGVSPGRDYAYQAVAFRNGQTVIEEDADLPPATPASTPTLTTPTWADDYPYGYASGPYRAAIKAIQTDPLASIEIYLSADETDAGFTLAKTLLPGQRDGTLSLPDPDVRWIYLVATRPGYTSSAASTHALVTFGE